MARTRTNKKGRRAASVPSTGLRSIKRNKPERAESDAADDADTQPAAPAVKPALEPSAPEEVTAPRSTKARPKNK